MTMPIELILKQNEKTFSKKEKIIANYILKNIDNIEKIKISTISKECNVYGSSIYGFFNKIHINSITELWTMINKETAIKLSNISKNYSSKVQESYWNVIEKNGQILDSNIIKKFINFLMKANTIYIMGLGSSHLAAIELNHRLTRLGFPSSAVEHSHEEIALKAATMKKNDLLISMSISGETEPIIFATEIAKKKGTKIVTISGNSQTTLSKLANFEVVLFSSPYVGNDSALTSTLLAYFFFIDLVISKIIEMNLLNNLQYEKKQKTK